ncbi:DUF3566 domain-containing protein [Brevibacterium yomogidense]|uniref:DUF3566 domain-containing protein n=1 Tax=Brevibacterium yomogidense TaxID=946573 RepID=A0A1X6WXF3_9MICO|nr:DUF3566 domain-containing protein [Brevibacterium yomogidense]SLM90485.1 hypothetical protein FM105_02035 [Brevibacterium yomogidense]
MSDNEQKPGKILRTSSGKGKTRLTASGGAADASAAPADSPGNGAGSGSGPTGGAGTAASAQASSGAPTRVSSASSGTRLSAGGSETRAQPAVSSPDHSAAAGSGAGAGSGAAAGTSPIVGMGRSSGSGPVGSGPGGSGPVGSGPSGTGGVKATSGGVKMSGKSKKGPRTVRLTIASIDPWSVMKMAFLLSLAIAIAMLVATLVLWLVLQATGVMGNIESTLSEIAGAESADQLLALVSLGRVMATAFVLALVNIVLMTALSTLFAFLYNIGASIVGGFHLTLTDD